MTNDDLLERTDRIAAAAHAGQTDKAGADYVTHPRRVSAAVEATRKKIVALLHDVVERRPQLCLSRWPAWLRHEAA